MPWLYNVAGDRYRTEDQSEITRLRAQGYTDRKERPPTVDDLLFHPEGQSAHDVLEYLKANPEDVQRVIAEEKAGKARTTIINFEPSAE